MMIRRRMGRSAACGVLAASLGACAKDRAPPASLADAAPAAMASAAITDAAPPRPPSPAVETSERAGVSAATQPRGGAATLHLASGTTLELQLPAGLSMTVAAEGFKRPRFMAKSPDGRLFVTELVNMSDNHAGAVYALSGWDPGARRFTKRVRYLAGLRNPNSVAFHEDGGRWYFYLALTDRLVRYPYRPGADAPAGEPETLATFPDYGLNYKYGGWHLTRTVAFGADGTLYVSAGSSCNACEEKEEVRATVQAMSPSGQGARFFARGLRNSVGLKWVDSALYATDMGADQFGDDAPDERMFALSEGKNYGWPYCYQDHAVVRPDPQFAASDAGLDCATVPRPYARFPAHSAPLGLEYFGPDFAVPSLRGSFIVALHGSTKRSIGHGYRLVQVRAGRPPEDFVTGFLRDDKVIGRPVDVLRWHAAPGAEARDNDAFLVTDDFAGAIYAVAAER
jgi:glucose/arabinose dehydrogenase